VLSSNQKGTIAEAEICAAAARCGIPVLRPTSDHCRFDLAFEIAGQLLRVQCKWGTLDGEAGVVKVNLTSSWCTPTGYARTTYAAGELDLIAVYCGELDRCYLLDARRFAERRAVWLRLKPPLNGQRACVNLSSDFEFNGAVAQLEERGAGSAQVRGSSPLSSIPPVASQVRANEFRNRFGWYMERAASGESFAISRHGRPFARLLPPEPEPRAEAPQLELVRSES
jgi:prevent-host-death family protein